VKFTALTGGAGLVAATNYYVNRVIDANNFTVAAVPPNQLGSPQIASVVASTDLFTTTGHGLVAGTPVRFSRKEGVGLPTPGVTYFVIASGLTANDFKVSATLGGATIDVTNDMSQVTWQTLGAADFNFTTDITVGTVTRYKTHQAGAHRLGGPKETLPGIQGPRNIPNRAAGSQ
jgi:hypothetical protein